MIQRMESGFWVSSMPTFKAIDLNSEAADTGFNNIYTLDSYDTKRK